MIDLVAFALREGLRGTVTDGDGIEHVRFTPGVVHVGDGDFDIGAALAEGDGVFVVHADDTPLLHVLENYGLDHDRGADDDPEARSTLVRVDVPEDAKVITPYDRHTDGALHEQATQRGLDVRKPTRAKLVDALVAHRAAASPPAG